MGQKRGEVKHLPRAFSTQYLMHKRMDWLLRHILPEIAKPWHHTPNNKTGHAGFSGGGHDDPSPRVAFERFAPGAPLP
jgi:hypothetical protein